MSRRLTLDDLSRLPLPGMDHPAGVAFVPDNRAITYLHSEDGSLVRSLWHHDLDSGERRPIVGAAAGTEREETIGLEERLRRERTRTTDLGVTSHAWATHAAVPTLLVPLAGQVLVARGDRPWRDLVPLAGIERAASAVLSPDGQWVACVMNGDLWAAPVDGGSPMRLTHDAEPGVTNGLAEYVAAEELDRFDGLWWSSDSRTIAFAHVDERAIAMFDVAKGGAGDEQETHRYPFAGGPNAEVELRIATLDAHPTASVALPMSADDYLARVVADPTGGWLVGILPRDQRSLRWWRVSPDGSARPLWVEHADPWINLDHATRVLADGRILATSERSGFRHLELRSHDGDLLRDLTAGGWVVTGVVSANSDRNEVLVTATRDSVLERHLYAVPLDAPRPVSNPQRLTEQPGWHEIVGSPDGTGWIDTFSDPDHAPRVSVHPRGPGAPISIWTPSTTAAPIELDPPQFLELTAADGQAMLHAALYRPTDAATGTGGPPPCVVWVYGGPHSQKVKRSWEMTAHLLRQYLRQQGAAVVVVDNRGTNNRGTAFEAALGGRFGSVEVVDQAAAVRDLAARGEIDPDRVAITGWSYGGFMTVMCMTREPSLFRVGVAGAPVVEWSGYDTAYTERYLGHPAQRADAYRDSSLAARAADVTGALLLIHGSLDENVHLRHSRRLVDALEDAGRPVELVLLAGQRHRTRGAAAIRLRERRTVAHLLDGLGLPLPEELLRAE